MENVEKKVVLQEINDNIKIRKEPAVFKVEEQNSEAVLSIGNLHSCYFSGVLSKIDEEDESRIKNSPISEEDDAKNITSEDKENIICGETQSPHVMWKSEDEIIQIEDKESMKMKQRPKSANSVSDHKPQIKRRSKSATEHLSGNVMFSRGLRIYNSSNKSSDSESNSDSSFLSVIGRPKSAGSKPKQYLSRQSACCWYSSYDPSRPRSACGVRTCGSEDSSFVSRGGWSHCDSNTRKYLPRKCRSNPNVSKLDKKYKSELQIDRYKRSLKLLGLTITDFGIYDSAQDISQYNKVRQKLKRVESTFTTKIVKRSISLDGLKEEVREAWLDDRLDSSHRKLLAQAAYEEWYFRKAEEAHQEKVKEKMKNKITKEKLENEFNSRKLKAEEQFRIWLEGKKKFKTTLNNRLGKPQSTQIGVTKTREEVELAYRLWKKGKDKQREEKLKLDLVEKEKKMNAEKQKEEKKVMAERAFTEWKRKLKETEKNAAREKMRKEKLKKELERKEKEIEKKTTFQTWKDMKDRELIMRRLKDRKAQRMANAVRLAQMEERMYEAEQAFEEWLDKIEAKECVLKSKKSVS